jgi:hypothetical protein
VFFEQVYGAFSLKLCSDVDGSPAEERGAEARDAEGNDITCPVHPKSS